MKTSEEIKAIAINTINNEIDELTKLLSSVDDNFVSCVQLIINSKARVIFTGIGKSANIGLKIVATLNSTGTPAVFMHAADAIHGDLGIIQKDDIVVCISKSGNTPEIKVLVPIIKMMKNKIIAMVGDKESFLAQNADFILHTSVTKEACPNNLAPTSSTTAQLVMGDALAVCLLECRGFTTEDFARFHPGGILGKNLYLKVSDLMRNNAIPIVKEADKIDTVIIEMTSKRLGATAVINSNNKIVGIITDGDLRRMLQKNTDISKLQAKDIYSSSPQIINKDTLAAKALSVMKSKNITQLIVCENDEVIGFVHLHDILKEGII